MAERKRNVVFDDVTWGGFYVWSALTGDQLLSVQGVATISPRTHGKFWVAVDPRYDLADVQAEIEALAAPTRPEDAEQKTSRWRVTVSDGENDFEFVVHAESRTAAACEALDRLRVYRLYRIFEITRLEWIG